MNYSYSKQQSSNRAQPLRAALACIGHPFFLCVPMIGLVLLCTGCLGFPEQAEPRAAQTTKMNQASIPAQLPASFALTPSITPSRSSPTKATNSPHVETFTGNGVKKTTAFLAPKSWRIAWSCDLASHNKTNYDLIIHANTTNNALLASSLETTCSKNNTHGLLMMNQAGNIYLVILSEGAWTVQVQY